MRMMRYEIISIVSGSYERGLCERVNEALRPEAFTFHFTSRNFITLINLECIINIPGLNLLDFPFFAANNFADFMTNCCSIIRVVGAGLAASVVVIE